MDEEILAQFEFAKAAWSHRSMTDHSPIQQALNTLLKIKGAASDPLTNYDTLILLCRVTRWMALDERSLPKRESSQSFYLQLFDIAKDALEISDFFSEAFFYAAESLCYFYCRDLYLIRENHPTLEVLFDYIDSAIDKPTRSNLPGITYEGYGPYRLKGEILTHDHKEQDALVYLEKAYLGATDFACNAISYANTFIKMSEIASNDKAKMILESLIQSDPNTLNPDRIPENKLEIEFAKEMLTQFPFAVRPRRGPMVPNPNPKY